MYNISKLIDILVSCQYYGFILAEYYAGEDKPVRTSFELNVKGTIPIIGNSPSLAGTITAEPAGTSSG